MSRPFQGAACAIGVALALAACAGGGGGDGLGGSTVNTAPTANPQSVVVQPDTPRAITLTATDPQADPLSFTVVAQPTNGALSGAAPNLTYTPNSSYTGPDSFSFLVNDGEFDSGTAIVSISVTAWQPPIGIPMPGFGITESAGAFTHYVDNTDGNATDSGNPNGSPALPRLTIPTSLSAGDAVEIYGGPYSGGALNISASGTSAQPIFIRGASAPVPVLLNRQITLTGAYIVFENLELDGCYIRFSANSDHIAVRDLEMHDYSPAGNSACISMTDVSDIVVFNCHIHNNGDDSPTATLDIHGVLPHRNAQRIWIVDNYIHNNGGDAVQINFWNPGPGDVPARWIYIGRNVFHGDRENAVDLKLCLDVVVSQNIVYDYRLSATSGAVALTAHSGSVNATYTYPERVWFIYNEVYDCTRGIHVVKGDEIVGGDQIYIIGNLLRDIQHENNPYTPGIYAEGVAIHARSCMTVTAINNTIYNCDVGITAADSADALHIANNIIANLAVSASWHVRYESPTAAASDMEYNLIYDTGGARIRWGTSTTYDVAGFLSAFSGTGTGCLEADPLFTNASTADYRLLTGSPAIDNGTLRAAYATFLSLYGIDIAVDFDGNARPAGAGWDMGAFER